MSLPPDPENYNDERALLADVAVQAYSDNSFRRPGDPDAQEYGFRELLCNLRHWADRNGKDWETVLAAAMDDYADEILDEDARPRPGR